MTRLLAAVLALVLVPGAACSSASEAEPESSAPSVTASSAPAEESTSASSVPSQTSEGAAQAAPRLKVTKIATGLDHPWDVHPIGQGRFLVTERVGRLAIIEDGKVRRLQMPTDLIWASGETGLMGLAIDPDFAGNGRFYTCSGGNPQGTPDVRIMVWKLNAAATRASYQRTLLSGFPATSGRHGGCRLLILDDGALLVGTGDAATGTNPEDKTSLGGKTLMLDRISGRPVARQPVRERRQQAPAVRPHLRPPQRPGPRPAGGRHPVVGRARPRPRRRGEPAQERWRLRLEPRARLQRVRADDRPGPARASRSRPPGAPGRPTVATSGASFVAGKEWGWYAGTLAVAALKASEVLFMKFDSAGKLVERADPGRAAEATAGSAPSPPCPTAACSSRPTTAATTRCCGCDRSAERSLVEEARSPVDETPQSARRAPHRVS